MVLCFVRIMTSSRDSIRIPVKFAMLTASSARHARNLARLLVQRIMQASCIEMWWQLAGLLLSAEDGARAVARRACDPTNGTPASAPGARDDRAMRPAEPL